MSQLYTVVNTWWFVSIQVEMPDEQPDPHRCAMGMDVGLNSTLAECYGIVGIEDFTLYSLCDVLT